MNKLNLIAFPGFTLLFWIIWEVVRFAVVRKKPSAAESPWLKIVSWSIRPWAAWSVFNLIYRFFSEKAFNNHFTFPFYANLWWRSDLWRNLARQALSFRDFQLWLILAAISGGLLFLLLRSTLFSSKEPSKRKTAAVIISAFCLTAALHIAINHLPGQVPMGRRDVVRAVEYPWFSQGTTMRHAALIVTNSTDYIRNFVEIQPNIERIIHAASHPPGASLSLYWIGLLAGRGEMPGITGFMIGLTIFSVLNLPVVFFLAKLITGSRRIGLAAALMWSVMPYTVIYNTFAQDGLYAVFFNLALLMIWHLTRAEKPGLPACVFTGLIFFCGAMLNYSVCLPATIFFLFALVTGLERKWNIRDYTFRFLLPGITGLLIFAVTLAVFKLDYLKMYLTAKGFVDKFYNYDGLYQATMALIGGQIDMLLMTSAVICSGFVIYLAGLRRPDLRRPEVKFLLIIIGIYLIPVLFGPSCLKMETSRCWNWVLTVPVILTVKMLFLRESGKLLITCAWLVALASSVITRLFMNFGC